MTTLDEFFAGFQESHILFEAVLKEVNALGAAEMKVSKSQIAFLRKKAFAWVWVPGKYLHGKTAPLVLTLSLRRRSSSPRWKEIVEPYPGRFTHHLELFSTQDMDDEVRGWLRDAWQAAG
jgi:hypothetical protein